MLKSAEQNQNIQEHIEKDFILALKDKSPSLAVLRMLKAAIKNAEIAKKDKLTNQEIITVLQKEKKQRQDSVVEFKKGNRQDLIDNETAEIKIIDRYLPAGMTDDQIRKLVLDQIKQVSASNISDIGRVMGQVMPQIKGRADGQKVSQIVKEELEEISQQ